MECKDYIVNNSLIALKTTYTRALIYNMLRKIKEAFVEKNIICFSPLIVRQHPLERKPQSILMWMKLFWTFSH